MEEDKTLTTTDETGVAKKDYNKKKWIGEIALKRIQNVPLSQEDWNFLSNMLANGDMNEYAQYIVGGNVRLDKLTDEADLDDETRILLLQKNQLVHGSTFKALSQKKRDDAATRKMDVSTFNKFTRMAKKKGYDPSTRVFDVEPVKVESVSAPDAEGGPDES